MRNLKGNNRMQTVNYSEARQNFASLMNQTIEIELPY